MPKTREGYYHYTGGVEAAIKRSLSFAPYADMIWLETKLPDLNQARSFARKIREKYPGKYVRYIHGTTHLPHLQAFGAGAFGNLSGLLKAKDIKVSIDS